MERRNLEGRGYWSVGIRDRGGYIGAGRVELIGFDDERWGRLGGLGGTRCRYIVFHFVDGFGG